MAVSTNFVQLQQIKFDFFKEQNLGTGQFDVAFEVKGKILYAHKTMLNLVSPTFTSMLSDRWSPNRDEPIQINNYNYEDFYQFVTFLYSAQCELTNENILAMVDIAEFYGVVLFKDYCDEYLAVMTKTTENIFKLIDLAEKYSMVKLQISIRRFITNNLQAFASTDGFLKSNKRFVEEVVAAVKDKVKPEDLFQAVYKWCENQALDKRTKDSNVNFNDAIKNEFSSFHPHIRFDKMGMRFLLVSVVPRRFLFTSPDELRKILSCRYSNTKVKITNSNGHTLCGNVIPDPTVIANIESLKLSTGLGIFSKSIWWDAVFEIPSTPSPLKKKDGIEWYLIYESDGLMGVKHCSGIFKHHYLLAELSAGFSGFQLTRDCKTEIE